MRLGLICGALGLLALPGGASAAPKHHPRDAKDAVVLESEPPHATISVRGTNGYEIEFSIGPGDTDVFVNRSDDELHSSASYSLARGRANARQVHASFGRVGRVSAHFVPAGKVERLGDLGCKGGPEIRRRGTFVGTIRFEGEEGFTRFSAHRVRGTISSAPRRVCGFGRDVVIVERADHRPEHFLTGLSVSATSDNESTFFGAFERELEPQVAEFDATRFEDRGKMFITRDVEIEDVPSAAFVFDAALNHATVAPPAPFAGSATFTRIDDFASRWEGPLTVTFPGAANVPLTGRAYAWSLDRSVDPSDFVEGMIP